ncbi:MAG: ankyrin repeat domain-containing protein [Abditibacteriota bacterium]|nr:ankyrin repeat domain-containing protein [Abditibacteriota bacterium]
MKRIVLLLALTALALSLQANTSDDLIALIHKGDYEAAAAALPEDVDLPAETGDLPLIACVAAGDGALGLAEQLIGAGADVNRRDAALNTPLCEAARSSAAFTRLLLDKGADVSIQDAYGRTPLFRAVAEQMSDVISMLLSAGSDVHKTDTTGNSPLSLAIDSDKPELLQLFIDAGADMNAPTGTDGRLPIELAMLTGKDRILAALNSSGLIDYQALNGNGSHIIGAAISSGNTEMCSLILDKGLNINAPVDLKENTALHVAASLSRTELITLFTDRGAGVNIRNGGGDTPLMLSLISPEAAAMLIEKGADVNMKNNMLLSPLAVASRMPRRESLIKLLCDAGADTRSEDLEGSTPVSLAEKYNPSYLEIMKESPSYAPAPSPLVAAVLADDIEKARAEATPDNVNARDHSGATPLFYARSAEMVGLLTSVGADVMALDHSGRNAVFTIAQADAVPALEDLFGRVVNTDASDYSGMTPLFFAGPAAGRLLLDKGSDPNQKTLTGNTPLFSAVAAMAPLLLEKGAELDHRNNRGETPLFYALSAGRVDCAAALAEAGADVSAEDDSGAEPIFPAVLAGADAVAMLIGKGADANVTDGAGRTPLIYAAEKNAPMEVFALLADKTEDPGKKDGSGFSALYYAVSGGREDMTRTLLEKGARPDDRENLFVNLYLANDPACHLPLTRLLLDAGADPNHRSPAGSPLLFAVWFGEADTVELLIDKGAEVKGDPEAAFASVKRGGETLPLLLAGGADPNAKTGDGITLLMQAAKYCPPEIIAALTDAGADPAPVSKANYTPMHGAAYNSRSAETAELLIAKGVSVGISAEGETPVYIASMMNRPEMAAALMAAGADAGQKSGDGKTLARTCRDMGYEAVANALEGKAPGEYDPTISDKLRYEYVIRGVPTAFETACVVSCLQDSLYNGMFDWESKDGDLFIHVTSALTQSKVNSRMSGLSRTGIFRLEMNGRDENTVVLSYVDI